MKSAIIKKSVLPALFIIAGIALIIFYSVGGGFRGYTGRTTGTVRDVIQTSYATDEDSSDEFSGTLTYSVGGEKFTIENFVLTRHYEDGEKIELAYDPANPGSPMDVSSVKNSRVMIPCGIAATAAGVYFFIRMKKNGGASAGREDM